MSKLSRQSLLSTNTTRYTKQQGETDPFVFPEDHIALGADVAESAEFLLEGAVLADVNESGIKFDRFKGYNLNTGASYAAKAIVLVGTDAIAGAKVLLQWTPDASVEAPTLVGDIPASVINRQELFDNLVLGQPNWVELTCLSGSPFVVIGLIKKGFQLKSTFSSVVRTVGTFREIHHQRRVLRVGPSVALNQNVPAYHNAILSYVANEPGYLITMPGVPSVGVDTSEAPYPFYRVTIGVEQVWEDGAVARLKFSLDDAINESPTMGFIAEEVVESNGFKYVSLRLGEVVTLVRAFTGESVSGYTWFVEDRRSLTMPETKVTNGWNNTPYESDVVLNLNAARRFYTEATGPINIESIDNTPLEGWDLVYEVIALTTGVTVTVTNLEGFGWTETGLTTPIPVPNGSKLELVISQRPGDLITVTWRTYSAAATNQPPLYTNVVLTGQYIGDTFQLTGSFSDPQNRSEDTSITGSRMDMLVFTSEALAQDFLDNDGNPDNATSLVNGTQAVGGSPTLSYTAQPGDASKYFVGGFLAKANNGNNDTDTQWRFSAIKGPVVVAPSGVGRTTLYTGPFVSQAWSATPYSQTVTIPGFAAPGTNRRAVLKVWGEGGAPGTLNVADATASLGGQAMANRQNNFFNDGSKQFAIAFDLPDANIPANGDVSLVVNLPFTPQLMIVQLDLLTNTSQAVPTQVQKGSFQVGEATVGFTPNITAAGNGMILSLITSANSGDSILPLNSQTMASLNISTGATAHTAQVLVPAGTYAYDFNVNGTSGTAVQVFYPAA